MPGRSTSTIVLWSGGIDSTALIAKYRRLRRVTAVHVDYGQPAANHEKRAVRRLAIKLRVRPRFLKFTPRLPRRGWEFLGRNQILVLVALIAAPFRPATVVLGIHQGSPYYDATERFAKDMQQILDGYFGGTVRLATPFSKLSKQEVVALARARDVPLEMTYSCQRGTAKPCRRCPSCKDREVLLAESKPGR